MPLRGPVGGEPGPPPRSLSPVFCGRGSDIILAPEERVGTPTVNDMMVAYAEDAVEHAKSAGVALDYSPDSIRQVEEVLEKLYPRGISRLIRRGPSVEDTATMAKMYGGYIGEVVRRAAGGEWVLDTEVAPGQTVISLRKGEQRIFPPSKVQKRLANGSEDNVWFYYQVLMKEHWK